MSDFSTLAQPAQACGSGKMSSKNLPPNEDADNPLYKEDNFRIYCLKVLPCSKRYCHDWTTCPWAHAQEKAKRRDPRVFSYTGIACPEMKKSMQCPRGDQCPYAHNVFEYWLHHSRYRTQLCNDGVGCKRKICFFAHSLDELRVSSVKVPEGFKGEAPNNAAINPFAPTPSSGGNSHNSHASKHVGSPPHLASPLGSSGAPPLRSISGVESRTSSLTSGSSHHNAMAALVSPRGRDAPDVSSLLGALNMHELQQLGSLQARLQQQQQRQQQAAYPPADLASSVTDPLVQLMLLAQQQQPQAPPTPGPQAQSAAALQHMMAQVLLAGQQQQQQQQAQLQQLAVLQLLGQLQQDADTPASWAGHHAPASASNGDADAAAAMAALATHMAVLQGANMGLGVPHAGASHPTAAAARAGLVAPASGRFPPSSAQHQWGRQMSAPLHTHHDSANTSGMMDMFTGGGSNDSHHYAAMEALRRQLSLAGLGDSLPHASHLAPSPPSAAHLHVSPPESTHGARGGSSGKDEGLAGGFAMPMLPGAYNAHAQRHASPPGSMPVKPSSGSAVLGPVGSGRPSMQGVPVAVPQHTSPVSVGALGDCVGTTATTVNSYYFSRTHSLASSSHGSDLDVNGSAGMGAGLAAPH